MRTQIEYLSVILRCQDCFNETPIIERGSKLKIASLNPVFRIIVEFQIKENHSVTLIVFENNAGFGMIFLTNDVFYYICNFIDGVLFYC